MKVNDILKEDNQEPKELTDKDYESIINSKFFKLNFEPLIDKKENSEENFHNIRKKILFHGTNEPIDYLRLSIKNIGKRDKPRDTPHALHHMVNDMLEEKFGVKLRDKLFTTNEASVAVTFGKQLSVVIPSDDYTLYTSENVNDFTFQVVNGLIGMQGEFDDIFIGGFKDYAESNSSELANQYNSLEGSGMKRFISVLKRLSSMIQTWIIGKKEDFDDIYDIRSYAGYDLIKKKFMEQIEKHFEQDEKAYGQMMNNIDTLTNDLIKFTNETMRRFFKRAFGKYVESIYSFEKIPDDIGTKEIIVDANYATFVSKETLEKVLIYYLERY